jgi:hypothetical protein
MTLVGREESYEICDNERHRVEGSSDGSANICISMSGIKRNMQKGIRQKRPESNFFVFAILRPQDILLWSLTELRMG